MERNFLGEINFNLFISPVRRCQHHSGSHPEMRQLCQPQAQTLGKGNTSVLAVEGGGTEMPSLTPYFLTA